MELEEQIKQKLLSRGFSKRILLNAKGLISVTIDETILIISKSLMNKS